MDEKRFNKRLEFMKYKINNWLSGVRIATPQEFINGLSIDVDTLQEELDKK